MLYRFFQPLAIILFKIFFLIRVKGKRNIPKKGGVIIASNHLSFLDPIALGAVSSRILSFWARDDLFHPPIFAWLMKKLNAYPLKRGKADLKTVKNAINRLKKGNALIIFPEGRRSRDGNIQKGETGCIWLSEKANVPIVPARIYGTGKAMPVNSWFIKPYPIKVIFGRAFKSNSLEKLHLKEKTNYLMERIKEL
jgi:1-acyl-sn-glycerol-3-phosphate acyltransferase